jgi:anti-anti-sigma regulatory factor
MAVPMSKIAVLLNIDEKRVVPALQDAADGLDGSGEAVLDFSSVRRIDSAAVRALEDFLRVADDKAVKIVLRNVSVDVFKVLKLVKLTQRFSFVN